MENITSCLRALQALLDVSWPRAKIGTDQVSGRRTRTQVEVSGRVRVADVLLPSGSERGAAQRPPQADGDQRVSVCPARRVGPAAAGRDGGSGARQGETAQC